MGIAAIPGAAKFTPTQISFIVIQNQTYALCSVMTSMGAFEEDAYLYD